MISMVTAKELEKICQNAGVDMDDIDMRWMEYKDIRDLEEIDRSKSLRTIADEEVSRMKLKWFPETIRSLMERSLKTN